MRVAVIICTHDRSSYAARSIESVLAQRVPAVTSGAARLTGPPPIEVIVVDNASSDDTTAVVAAISATAPIPVRLLHEPTLGLSHARNTGLSATTADIVVFLDDDAVAEAGWLDAVIETFAGHDAVGVAIGPIDALWGRPRPDWLTEDVESYFTVLDLGDDAHDVSTETQWFAGANIAFRRSVLDAVGGFPTHLGRVGAMLLSNEEREVVRRIEAAGARLTYAPEMRVGHTIHADRMRRRWLLRRGYWQGVSNALAKRRAGDPAALVDAVRMPGYAADTLVTLGVVSLVAWRGLRDRDLGAVSMRQRVGYATRVGERVARWRLRRLD